jgi:hypothetical protein
MGYAYHHHRVWEHDLDNDDNDDNAYTWCIHVDNATQLLERSSQLKETLKDSEINLKNLIEHYKLEVWLMIISITEIWM